MTENLFKDMVNMFSPKASQAGGKNRKSKKGVAVKPKSSYKRTKKTVKCGDGVERTVYRKDGKSFVKKMNKEGKFVMRPAPKSA